MLLKEFKMERKSLIIWSLALILFLLAGMQKYTAFTGVGAEQMLKLFDDMPYVLKAMFGMASLDVTTIVGYYGALYFYLVLILAVHALLLGIRMVSKDEKERTAEFLYTKPISRQRILLNKLIVSVFILIILNLVVFITALFIIHGFSGEYLVTELFISSVSCFLIQLIFLSIGNVLAIVIKSNKKALYLGLSYLSFALILSVAIDVVPDFAFLKILTPFKYADPKLFLNDQAFNYPFIFFQIVIILILQLLAFNKIDSRDLNI